MINPIRDSKPTVNIRNYYKLLNSTLYYVYWDFNLCMDPSGDFNNIIMITDSFKDNYFKEGLKEALTDIMNDEQNSAKSEIKKLIKYNHKRMYNIRKNN